MLIMNRLDFLYFLYKSHTNLLVLTPYVLFCSQPTCLIIIVRIYKIVYIPDVKTSCMFGKSEAYPSTFPGDFKLIIRLIILPAPGKPRQILYSIVCVDYNL